MHFDDRYTLQLKNYALKIKSCSSLCVSLCVCFMAQRMEMTAVVTSPPPARPRRAGKHKHTFQPLFGLKQYLTSVFIHLG